MFKSLNKVIRILIFSDLALLSGLGFIVPIFAIFIAERIEGGNIEVVGFAAGIYWVVNSLVMVPLAKYLDKKQGERDDLIFIVIGNSLSALSVFGYFFSTLPWHIYLLQAIYGVGMGMNVPGYAAIFTRHIDKDKEAFGWSMRASSVGIGAGVAGVLGGIIAQRLGFDYLFLGVIVFIIISAFLPFLLFGQIKKQ